MVKLERMVSVVKFMMKLCGCWPPSPNASKRSLKLRKMWWIIRMCVMGHALLEFIQSIARSTDDVSKMTMLVTEMGSILLGFFKIGICRSQRDKLQTAHAQFDEYTNKMTPREREVLQGCVSKCTSSYITLGTSVICAATAFCIAPVFLDKFTVSDVDYVIPKSIDSLIIRFIIYMLEVISTCIAGSCAFLDFEIGLLLWYFGSRFQVLGYKFMEATTSEKFDKCIVEHQEILANVENVVVPTRYIALSVNNVTILGIICSAYQFVSPTDFETKARFFLLFCCCALEVLMYSWPSDYLLSTSQDVAIAAFHSPWINGSRTTSSKVYTVMMRAQKGVSIHIDGLLPQLNLVFYATFLTTSFSYFTTLRAVSTG